MESGTMTSETVGTVCSEIGGTMTSEIATFIHRDEAAKWAANLPGYRDWKPPAYVHEF